MGVKTYISNLKKEEAKALLRELNINFEEHERTESLKNKLRKLSEIEILSVAGKPGFNIGQIEWLNKRTPDPRSNDLPSFRFTSSPPSTDDETLSEAGGVGEGELEVQEFQDSDGAVALPNKHPSLRLNIGDFEDEKSGKSDESVTLTNIQEVYKTKDPLETLINQANQNKAEPFAFPKKVTVPLLTQQNTTFPTLEVNSRTKSKRNSISLIGQNQGAIPKNPKAREEKKETKVTHCEEEELQYDSERMALGLVGKVLDELWKERKTFRAPRSVDPNDTLLKFLKDCQLNKVEFHGRPEESINLFLRKVVIKAGQYALDDRQLLRAIPSLLQEPALYIYEQRVPTNIDLPELLLALRETFMPPEKEKKIRNFIRNRYQAENETFHEYSALISQKNLELNKQFSDLELVEIMSTHLCPLYQRACTGVALDSMKDLENICSSVENINLSISLYRDHKEREKKSSSSGFGRKDKKLSAVNQVSNNFQAKKLSSPPTYRKDNQEQNTENKKKVHFNAKKGNVKILQKSSAVEEKPRKNFQNKEVASVDQVHQNKSWNNSNRWVTQEQLEKTAKNLKESLTKDIRSEFRACFDEFVNKAKAKEN